MPNQDVVYVRSSSLSNNQQAEKNKKPTSNAVKPYLQVPKDIVGCTGSVGPHDDIVVTKPFCDKISIVGWLDADCLKSTATKSNDVAAELATLWTQARAKLTSKQHAAEEDGTAFKIVRAGDYSSGKTRLGPSKASTIIGVGTGKSKKEASFRLKLDFNPHRLGPSGLAQLEGVLDELFLDTVHFDLWLANAKVPVIDVAVDLINLDVCDAILRSDVGVKWSGWFGQFGRVQTWSHLKKKNKRGKRPPLLRLYDKKLELIETGKEPDWGDVPHARLERRLPQNKRPFLGLRKIKNPFADIGMGHVGWSARKFGPEFRLFFGAAQWMGLELASQLLSDDRRPTWRAAVRHGDAPFWKPTEFWTGWSGSLKCDGLASWLQRAVKASQKT